MLNILTPPSSLPSGSYSRHTPSSRAPHQSCGAAAYGQSASQQEETRFAGHFGRMGSMPPSLSGNGLVGSGSLYGSQLDGPVDLSSQKATFYPIKNNSYSSPANGAPYARSARAHGPPAVPYQPSSPVKAPVFEALGGESDQADSGNQIVSYLQIPSTINDSKGSLSDFAAQITCLFWFESSYTLHRIEDSSTTPVPLSPLIDDAKPCIGFRKWVTTMLSTTQVTQNVILLALLFIYRLKKQNPQVKGKLGSEYRLLTVALMLGNKFLDDNTYTNKTWADVSGIAVNEIHVMEVEFLSNMRYNLYTSKQEWQRWHKKLSRFSDYFDRASKAQEFRPLAPPLAIPSPPQSQHASPSFATHDAAYSAPIISPSYVPTIPTPAQRMPEVDLRPNQRKRSYDDSAEQPQAKRVLRSHSAQPRPMHSRVPSNGSVTSESAMPRLPMPMYPQMPFSQPPMMSAAHAQLPPPQARAMTMVYGNGQPQPQQQLQQQQPQQHSQQYSQQHPQQHSQQPLMPPLGGSPGSYQNGATLSRLQIPPIYTTPRARRTTPMGVGSATGSPTNLAMTPNNELLPPSGYTIQRSSPYRPVRAVHTLLVPPPSGSFQNPPQHIPISHMHYQPLGRPLSERRAGVVPFVHSDQANWAHYSPFR